MNLKKSSTITNPNLCLLRLSVLVGPNKSICNNSKGLKVIKGATDLNDFLVCLPWAHEAHTIVFLFFFIFGKPFTREYLSNLFRTFSLA